MSWIRRLGPAGASRVRLICLPHAGGSANFFFGMSRALAPEVEVLAVQYPGRQDRRHEPNLTDMGELADRVAEAVPSDDQPFGVFGHSMGAILAYEVGLRLSAAGAPPVRVFVSGRRAPSRYRDERVHQRDDDGILAELRVLNGTDATLLDEPELRALILASVRSDYQAVETYRHEPGRTLACPITVLSGDRDPKVTADEAQAWDAHTTAGIDVVTYPGGHFYLVEQSAAVTALVAGQLLQAGERCDVTSTA